MKDTTPEMHGIPMGRGADNEGRHGGRVICQVFSERVKESTTSKGDGATGDGFVGMEALCYATSWEVM